MNRNMVFACLFAFLLIIGGLLFAAEYQVSEMTFSGVMSGTDDTDWLILAGQEGTQPTVCLHHQEGVDFDIALYNDDQEVCSNIETGTRTCCRGAVPGQGKIKVWSANGSGNYRVTIHTSARGSREPGDSRGNRRPDRSRQTDRDDNQSPDDQPSDDHQQNDRQQDSEE